MKKFKLETTIELEDERLCCSVYHRCPMYQVDRKEGGHCGSPVFNDMGYKIYTALTWTFNQESPYSQVVMRPKNCPLVEVVNEIQV